MANNPMLDANPEPGSPASLKSAFSQFLTDRFDLRDDQAYEGQTLETVRKDVQFRGANLWILLFAILICSIGLNVNSPAVIIGAMLISPLMGPILGIGVGVAIYDFDLLLTAFKNLGIATLASVAISALYFVLSPITEAQSELLARVSPTLWDVLIATFGGFAGIIAVSRREKGNALPGVAIATALMPPICTAGYAIATGQWIYFAGSLYLFFINIVFIAVSTFVLVRFMRFRRHQFVDEKHEKRVRRYILVIVVAVSIPSIYTAYTTVQKSVYLQRATRFIDEECDFPGAEIIARDISKADEETGLRRIELVLVGKPVDSTTINDRRARLERHGLPNTELLVMQDSDDSAMSAAQLSLLKEQTSLQSMYKRNEMAVIDRDSRIRQLEQTLATIDADTSEFVTLAQEAEALFPDLTTFQFARLHTYDANSHRRLSDKGVVYLPADAKISQQEVVQLKRWLSRRTNLDSVLILQ